MCMIMRIMLKLVHREGRILHQSTQFGTGLKRCSLLQSYSYTWSVSHVNTFIPHAICILYNGTHTRRACWWQHNRVIVAVWKMNKEKCLFSLSWSINKCISQGRWRLVLRSFTAPKLSVCLCAFLCLSAAVYLFVFFMCFLPSLMVTVPGVPGCSSPPNPWCRAPRSQWGEKMPLSL